MSKHLSRKFLAALVAQLAAFLLQWNGKMDIAGNAYMLIVLGTVAAYITGNVAQVKALGRTE